MKRYRILILGIVLLVMIAFFLGGIDDYLTLESIKLLQERFDQWFVDAPWLVAGGFFLVYVLIAALSLPGATLLTLLGGALFGLGWGFLIISFASTIGATLAFLLSRTLFREAVERRFSQHLETINRGVERDGALYLFSLRLVPIFPFFVVNLAMGLTRLRISVFYIASQIGMIPGTLVYVNAGQQLGELQSLSGVVSPSLLLSFALLGIFPLIGRWAVDWLQRRKRYRGYIKPRYFDYDILVIGGGSAGLVTSYIASAVRARVALVERDAMGGDCLNTGCVPSKALIRAARAAQNIRDSKRLGVHAGNPHIDFGEVMDHVRGVIQEVAPHDSEERYTGLGVEVKRGTARLRSPWSVDVDGKPLTARHIVLATGATPKVPSIPGIGQIEVLTSENLWTLTELPLRLVVLGGGAIGCELGQSFARLGSQVTLIEGGEQLLGREDEEVGELVADMLAGEGLKIMTRTKALEVLVENGEQQLLVEVSDGLRMHVPFDRLLVSVGRQANVDGLGLEAMGIATRDNGTLEVNEQLQTWLPNIWACGDVAGPYQLTHAAAHQAWHVAINALFGEFKRFKVDYRVMPSVTYLQPEVARVGINEREAKAQGIDYEITRYDMADSDRAIAERATTGFVKILTVPGKDRILGATLVGESAGEWLAELTLAMKQNIGLNKLLGTIHPYPTFSEAVKGSAGVWKNTHKPERVLGWLSRYFRWRRGKGE
ncbi:pyruvate/2-oxoglutarate dehydrogenase complex dihydrolipoamide dehydrogenase (E3) component [Modicisalibacter xianhensis]|uniref:Pyruvate/2-oxoglutarate dehydrogenase complex dihydrolipoamide dehydrogenase (E3) component n=1 Tax=Modicisalibacter xianhensis TaxID=442341 RepID=A0A4R8FPU8_9GAMM|nr:FAD-dependent oxidoreductase [Halomonas xianhensis]TDX28355.1 pyruvate/2-oxoglutarate dehydrogenase complex dihydrolipoamide dehydrogenase (E3) component [Halomonas xianhensis]